MASLSSLFVLSSTGRRIRWINLQIHPVLHLSSRHQERCCGNQNLDCYSIRRKSGARELSFCSILSTRRPRDRSFSRHVTKIGTDVLVLIFRNAKNFNWFDSFSFPWRLVQGSKSPRCASFSLLARSHRLVNTRAQHHLQVTLQSLPSFASRDCKSSCRLLYGLGFSSVDNIPPINSNWNAGIVKLSNNLCQSASYHIVSSQYVLTSLTDRTDRATHEIQIRLFTQLNNLHSTVTLVLLRFKVFTNSSLVASNLAKSE